MITVVTPATSRKLTTLANVLAYLGIESGDDDALLNSLIVSASAVIERITGRIFARQEYLEKVAPPSGKILVLEYAPLVEVKSVKLDDQEVEDYSVYDYAGGMLYRDRGWGGSEVLVGGIAPFPVNAVEKRWSVQYVAGYVLPDGKDSNLPADVELACMMLVRDMYYSRKRVGTVQSEKIGDYSVSYGQNGIAPAVMDLLRPWMRLF